MIGIRLKNTMLFLTEEDYSEFSRLVKIEGHCASKKGNKLKVFINGNFCKQFNRTERKITLYQ
jgi:hypothetical protein